MFNEIPKNCRYGYARVSSKSQEDNSSLEAQKEEFIQQGVPKKNIRFEVGSAADPLKERPVFQKLIEEELQENDFSLHKFESYPIIGPLKVLKEGRFLIVRMSILKQIYDYQYPFLLPRSFLSYKNRYELYIKIEILRVLAVKDRKKIFHLDNFLNKFSVSNRKMKEMKILLVTYLNELKEFFEPTFLF